jgi:hypothetical protein
MPSGTKRYKAGKIGQTGVSAEIDLDLRALQTLIRQIPQGANKVAEYVAARLRDQIIQSFEESPPTGRRYGAHIASSPGNPPRIYTGRLERSANIVSRNAVLPTSAPEGQTTQVVKTERQGEYILVFRAKHALYLEFGTPRMAARPFMRPAIHKYTASGQFTRDAQNRAKALLKELTR